MRRSTLLAGSATCALWLAAAPAAQAAQPDDVGNPDIERFEFTEGPVTDPDFCGTGEAVEFTLAVEGVSFLAPKSKVDFASVAHGTQTFTYGDTTVVGHFAGRFTDTIVAGEEGGVHTHEFTNIGLPEQFRLQGGGLITLDAGTITFLVTFDENDEVIDEEVFYKGPHPQAESDFELFCEVIPEALGIPTEV